MATTPTVLLFDLGNVVFDIDFNRCFAHWADASGADAQAIAKRFSFDAQYEAHEVGSIDFPAYCAHLSVQLNVALSDSDWRDGWNAIFRGVFERISERLPALSAHYRLAAFTNTNATHAEYFNDQFAATLAHFEYVFASHECGFRKPAATAYDAVVAQLGITPEQVLFFDDVAANVSGAESAGLRAQQVGDIEHFAQTLDALVPLQR